MEATAYLTVAAGEGALRRERLPEPGPDQVRVRTLASGVSRGTEMLVHRHAVPEAVRALIRCPFQAGDLPGPVKYGYLSVGVVEAGPPQLLGKRVFCLHPNDVFPLGSELFFDVEGNPEKIDVIYRFFELFDWANVKVGREILEAWSAGTVAIAPPMRTFQEEKLALAKPDAIVLHPGPMNRGVEIDSAVADGVQAVILPQVTFGIAVRMAVMSMLARG